PNLSVRMDAPTLLQEIAPSANRSRDYDLGLNCAWQHRPCCLSGLLPRHASAFKLVDQILIGIVSNAHGLINLILPNAVPLDSGRVDKTGRTLHIHIPLGQLREGKEPMTNQLVRKRTGNPGDV